MTADLPDGYTATLGTPSGDAEGVEVPGWSYSPDSTPPIHRRGETCETRRGGPCAGLTLPAGLVREMALGNGHSDIEEDA